jgi:cytochrome P450 family 97 subfamily B polypeptide 3
MANSSLQMAVFTVFLAVSLLFRTKDACGFVPKLIPPSARLSPAQKWRATTDQETTTETSPDPAPFFLSQPGAPPQSESTAESGSGSEGNADGLPWWWESVWTIKALQPSPPEMEGTACTLGDSAYVLRTNIEQIYGDYPSLDGCPIATGEIGNIADGTMFIGLQNYYQTYGSPYKLCFGPKSFLVVSDPMQMKHILRDYNSNYDKGVLAEILEPIMGKGLIPADPETWAIRRRQIVPGFHKAWLRHMVGLFAYCNRPLMDSLNAQAGSSVEMEERFCSVALDIIGKSVFNFEFGSVTSESPVIKAVYSALVEAEHRSMTPLPYWDIIPFANQIIPRLRKFNSDLSLLNGVLDDLITLAKNTRCVEDLEELENRNYAEVSDPSLLRFLVDMRGADIDNKQLRDDLMTMLIAGHETTAAVLTWSLFELVKNPDCMAKAQEEIDRVVGDREPTFEDIKDLLYLRLVVAETLRMYPEPPLLIRRCRTPDHLPPSVSATTESQRDDPTVIRGMDLFLAIYNLHRDERYWPKPDQFDPDRFLRKYSNPDIPEWAGYDPDKWINNDKLLYPNEVASDFAYLPFGGGARKCVGDEFATLEAVVTLTMTLRRFNFAFDPAYLQGKDDVMSPAQGLNHPVGMRTGATIHTRNGLHMLVTKRNAPSSATAQSQAEKEATSV